MVPEKVYDKFDNFFLLDERPSISPAAPAAPFSILPAPIRPRCPSQRSRASERQIHRQKNDLHPEVPQESCLARHRPSFPSAATTRSAYGVRLQRRLQSIGIPKTMDNDVPGTDYCIGFSTCGHAHHS